ANNSLVATLSSGNIFDGFGTSVAAAGSFVAVGGVVASVSLFDVASANPTTPTAILHNPGPLDADIFGASVAMSGNYLVARAPNEGTGAQGAGSVYVYNLASANPTTPIVTLHNPSPQGNGRFGTAVAVSGNYVVVGAPYDSQNLVQEGSAYAYNLA